MTDRPIMFTAPMVRALLEGRKTQTRRALYKKRRGEMPAAASIYIKTHPNGFREACKPPHDFDWGSYWALSRWAQCKPGDRLWVRERFNISASWKLVYETDTDGTVRHAWKSALYMRREHSRLTLTVTDVRVQRVRDISEEDAKAEGVTPFSGGWLPCAPAEWTGQPLLSAREAFEWLWDGINQKRGFGWDANPWVAAVSFTVEQGNIDG